MENTKVFFTDLDDTLLDSRKTVSGENQGGHARGPGRRP